MLHNLIHVASFGLDFILIGAGLWMAFTSRRLQVRGVMGATITQVAAGAVVLGFAHLIESLMFHVMGLPAEVNELTHRIIILVGFVFITNGLRRFAASLQALRPA
jgi:hypothetical protein